MGCATRSGTLLVRSDSQEQKEVFLALYVGGVGQGCRGQDREDSWHLPKERGILGKVFCAA